MPTWSIPDDVWRERVEPWLKEQKDATLRRQRERCESCGEAAACTRHARVPYHGAIGGATTVTFTSTSLGVVTKIEYAGTDATLDITPYDDW